MQMHISQKLKVNIILLAAVFLTASILYLSLIRTDDLPSLEVKSMDKFYHALAYFSLTLSWLAYITFRYPKVKSKYLILVLGLILCFGIIIEVLQKTFTNYRMFDYQDIIANSIGVALSYLFYVFILKRSLDKKLW